MANRVNMASPTPSASPLFLRETEIRRGVELLYFGNSHLTRAIDQGLASKGLGRAHHRALYFIARKPVMTVSELLSLLAITKQSLGRVLRQLVDGGFVEQLPGAEDRRQRRLFPTQEGRDLALELSRAQAARIEAALGAAGPDETDPVANFLLEMSGDRDSTKAWFERNGIGSARGRRP